jgi:hypothetical protein
MNSPSRPGISIAGEISELPHERYEEALWPFLKQRFPGDPGLDVRWKDELCELRVRATDFDILIYDGLITCSYLRGPHEEAIAFVRELSAVLARHGVWHRIEVMLQEPSGEWGDILVIP